MRNSPPLCSGPGYGILTVFPFATNPDRTAFAAILLSRQGRKQNHHSRFVTGEINAS